MKTLALSELRRIAERTRIVRVPITLSNQNNQSAQRTPRKPTFQEVVERTPWRVWYVAASNGDCILGEECVTLAVYPDTPFGSRLVQFTASGQTRRLRDVCILRANDFQLRV